MSISRAKGLIMNVLCTNLDYDITSQHKLQYITSPTSVFNNNNNNKNNNNRSLMQETRAE